jgi:hypothetical protein
MDDPILIITALFLLLTFAFVEIYTRLRGKTGTLVSIHQPDALLGWISCHGKARLTDGAEVDVDMPGCTVCMERLRPGDKVRIVSTRQGYRLVGKTLSCKTSPSSHCPTGRTEAPLC